jgi:hypothetical protein
VIPIGEEAVPLFPRLGRVRGLLRPGAHWGKASRYLGGLGAGLRDPLDMPLRPVLHGARICKDRPVTHDDLVTSEGMRAKVVKRPLPRVRLPGLTGRLCIATRFEHLSRVETTTFVPRAHVPDFPCRKSVESLDGRGKCPIVQLEGAFGTVDRR